MDRSRPRTSRPRRRSEPLVAKPRPQYSESGTETDTETLKAFSPKSLFPGPEPAEVSSDARFLHGEEDYSPDFDSDDADTVISVSPKQAYPTAAPPMSYSDVRSPEGDGENTSTHDSDDADTVFSVSPKQAYPTAAPPMSYSDVRSPEGHGENTSTYDSDDADTVFSVSPKQAYPTAAPPMTYSDVRSPEGDGENTSTYDSDDEQSIVSIPLKREKRKPPRGSSTVRTEKCLEDETPRIPLLNLDDLESISGKSSVTLKSIKGFTDLKLKDFKRRDSSGSRIGEQLKRIDSKNMLFFPSKNLTRPSIESIYGPVKKRSPSLLRQHFNPIVSSKTTSSLSSNKPRTSKAALVEDTPRPPVDKGAADKPSESITKKIEPKILPPLMTKRVSDKKIEKNRATPVKPKPFMASGCGKGIPSLENLPKPKIGRLPSFILSKKKEADDSASLRSRSLNVLDNTDIKPALPKALPSISKTTDDLFTRNRIPLRKHGSQSSSNLIASSPPKREKPKHREASPAVKPKKSVTFLLPKGEIPKTEEPDRPPKSAYIDECRRQYIDLFEKPPTFDEGPLPVTEPSPIYQVIQKLGWDYTKFTPKKPDYPVPTIPYNFLDQYLHIFDNNLERAAVHTKHGLVTICTCENKDDGANFCEKHIDVTKLQYYQEAAQVMMGILSIDYEVPEFDEAANMFQENYPFIYRGWVIRKSYRVSMDYRVREARCKSELVEACEKVLEEEDLLAESQQSEEILGHRRGIPISGYMKDVEEDFEYSYTFLFKEYPHLFIQLVQKIEFMPLAIERKIIAVHRKAVVAKAGWPEERLRAVEEYQREKMEH